MQDEPFIIYVDEPGSRGTGTQPAIVAYSYKALGGALAWLALLRLNWSWTPRGGPSAAHASTDPGRS